MVSNTLCLFFFTTLTLYLPPVRSTEGILCRSCGSDVSSSNHIFIKSSPSSHYSFNDTLFDKIGVQVQVFLTDVFFYYPLVIFTHSTCVEVGEWEAETSWFPGYYWKPCVCPECGAYIGFIFKPIDPLLVEPSHMFYGLILTTVVSENCKYDTLQNVLICGHWCLLD